MQSSRTPWLSLDGRIPVDVSSEADGHSLLGALATPVATEWRAARSGPQVIRVQFIAPQDAAASDEVEQYTVSLRDVAARASLAESRVAA